MYTGDARTVGVLLLGLVGVVLVTYSYTAQGNLAEFAPLPTATGSLEPSRIPRPTQTPSLAVEEACLPTPKTPGFAYKPGAPLTTTLTSPDLDYPRFVISGTVYAADCQTPLPDTHLEVWHADAAGDYDQSRRFLLRGRLVTDLRGRYQFTTTMPGRFGTGTEPLPMQIHFRISYQDHPPLFTQLHFRSDPLNFRFQFIRPAMIIPLTRRIRQDGVAFHGQFDLVLPVEPPSG